MPELPEVETFRRYIEKTALKQTIRDVVVSDARILSGTTVALLQKQLQSRRFETTRRYGKYAFVRAVHKAAPDIWVVLHFGMTGYVEYLPHLVVEPRFTRVRFDFEHNAALAYCDQRFFGKVGLTEDPDDFIHRLGWGPDALTLDAATFKAILARGKGPVKPFLLEQKNLAGIGNIYADEMLFQTSILPNRRLDALSPQQVDTLYQAMADILQTAVAAKAEFNDYPAGFISPRRNKKAQCPKCGAPLKQMALGGRTAYYCSACQT